WFGPIGWLPPRAAHVQRRYVAMTARYLEDFTVGQRFGSGRLRMDTEQITTFAFAFNPQPFHLDEEAARNTLFRGLTASGWHTAAVTMRLLVESDLTPAAGIVGAGFDELFSLTPMVNRCMKMTSRTQKQEKIMQKWEYLLAVVEGGLVMSINGEKVGENIKYLPLKGEKIYEFLNRMGQQEQEAVSMDVAGVVEGNSSLLLKRPTE